MFVGLLLAMGGTPAQAQRVLLHAEPAADSLPPRYGPNRAFYQHLFAGYSPVAGRAEGAGAALRHPQSAETFLGLRTKFRLSGQLAMGADVRYARLQYQLKQTSGKLLPNAQLHDREALMLSQVQLEPFLRLGFGRRGNVIGHYLDVSGWGGWAMATTHYYEDRPGTGGGTSTLVKERQPRYLRRWAGGVGTRLGSGRYGVVARYRLSSSFTPAADPAYAELPRWLLGLELGVF
ncbi:hypothetical protein D0T11_19175 [Hymenobacter rubripertinctus]|uniref:Outer membrane protein beta-barrel domain-containing protein n=1 Tax=Hymenobacter rubripertinctus TaxID=2029981 RepID=A0A418QM87_9BACT|nr:hypothetical protein D0T11_19175 [Hymenobacter rubripertinctus]